MSWQRTLARLPTLRPMKMVRVRPVAKAVLAGVSITVLVAALPFVPAATEQPVLRVVVDTVVALVACLLAYLLYGRYLLRRRLVDLLLAGALALAAVVNGGLAVAPQLVPETAGGLTLLAWGPASGRLVVAAGFAAAALLPPSRTVKVRHPGWLLVTGAVAVGGLIAVLLVSAAGVVPGSAVADGDTTAPTLQAVGPEAGLVSLRWLAAALYLVAAVGFSRRGADPLRSSLVAACVLQVFARANYALVPSLYANLFYAGDVLRLAAYGVLLVGAGREIRRSWSEQAQRAVEKDRRLLARSLHDGIAQELSVVATQARLWANGSAAMPPRLIAGAAERALDESRAAIHAMTGRLDEPFDQSLLRLVDDLEGRLGLRVRTDVQPVARLPEDLQTAMLRAAREALVNTGHHSGAEEVEVRLGTDSGVRLVVMDVGRGFDPLRAGEGFGLEVARARLASVGGSLVVTSAPGEGTTVEVQVPWPR